MCLEFRKIIEVFNALEIFLLKFIFALNMYEYLHLKALLLLERSLCIVVLRV